MRLFFFEVTLTPTIKAKLRRLWTKLIFQTHSTAMGRWVRLRLEERRHASRVRAFRAAEFPPVHAPDHFGFTTTARPKYGVEQDQNLIDEVEKLLRLPDKIWDNAPKIVEK